MFDSTSQQVERVPECLSQKMHGTTNANVARKAYPFVYVDFTSNREGSILSWSELADFVFDELEISKNEITEIRTIRGKASTIVRLRSREEIRVKERFANKFEFQRSYGDKIWNCVIRGAQLFAPLRYLNVPDTVSLTDLEQATSTFALLKSTISEETFEDRHDPRLSGLPNGNKRALIQPIDTIPNFLEVGPWKIRITHREQTRRCYTCQKDGHYRSECPLEKRNVQETEPEGHMFVEEKQTSCDELIEVEKQQFQDNESKGRSDSQSNLAESTNQRESNNCCPRREHGTEASTPTGKTRRGLAYKERSSSRGESNKETERPIRPMSLRRKSPSHKKIRPRSKMSFPHWAQIKRRQD